jgi:hypothetical protein
VCLGSQIDPVPQQLEQPVIVPTGQIAHAW